jgi:hypothetical protein
MKNGPAKNISVEKYGSTKVQFQKYHPTKQMAATTIKPGIVHSSSPVIFIGNRQKWLLSKPLWEPGGDKLEGGESKWRRHGLNILLAARASSLASLSFLEAWLP